MQQLAENPKTYVLQEGNWLVFRVYNRRRESFVTYRLAKTATGWGLRAKTINGDCKPDGTPFFYENFNQDNIKYPRGFGDFLEHIWSQLDKRKIADAKAQKKLHALAKWVSVCEKSQPKWKGWNV